VSSAAFCILYAVADELHQLFVPGRAASPVDVLIDTGGALLGILLFALLRFLIRKKRSKA
jgi:VanZ family protein